MKNGDLKKSIEELNIELDNGFTKYEENMGRAGQLIKHTFEGKVLSTFICSVFPYIALAILSIIGAVVGVTLPIPGEIFPIIIAGSVLGTGTIVRKIYERKNKIKEKLKKITKATTDYEILEEEIKYEIEVEKNTNRNKTIEQAISLLESEQSNLDELSDKYDIKEKNMPSTKEEAQNEVARFSDILKKQYDELDLLSTKMFWYNKNNIPKNTLSYELIATIFTNIWYLSSIVIARILTPPPNIIIYFMPFVALSVCSIGYAKKRKKDYKRIFNDLNKDLDVNVSEGENLENKIKEISMTIIQLQEQKRILESFSNDDDEKELELESSLMNEFTYSQENLSTFMDKDILTNPNSELENGPSLELKRNHNTPNNNN